MWQVLVINKYELDGRTLAVPVLWDRNTLLVDPITSLYLFHLVVKLGRSLNTVTNYATTLSILLNEIERDPNIDGWQAMTERNMWAFLEYKLHQQRELTGSTIDQYSDRLKQFYEWAFDNGWLVERPQFSWTLSNETMLKIAKDKGVRKSNDPFSLYSQYISEDEFLTMLRYKPCKKQFEIERDDLILKLGYYSGFRAGETLDEYNISVKRIHSAIKSATDNEASGFWLDIIGKGINGGKVRTIYVPEHITKQLQRFIDGTWKRTVPTGSDLLICKRSGDKLLNREHASKLFTKTVKNLIANGELDQINGFITNKNRHYHSLRHSYATNLAEYCRKNGLSQQLVQDRLGHSNPDITKIYVHFNAILHKDTKTADELSSQLPIHLKNFVKESLNG